MKWLLWAMLLFSPTVMSITRDYPPGTGVVLPVALLAIGLPLGGRASVMQDVAAAALAAVGGGLLGIVVGVGAWIVTGYWAGALSGFLLLIAGALVAARCRLAHPEMPLLRGL